MFWFNSQITKLFSLQNLKFKKIKLPQNLASLTSTDIHAAFYFPSLPIKVLYLCIFKDCIKNTFFLCLIRKHYHNRSVNEDSRSTENQIIFLSPQESFQKRLQGSYDLSLFLHN